MVKKIKDAATSEKILEAARHIFLVKGMTGARMQDIADAAGINKALLHYYFTNKETLFEKVFLSESEKFIPRINEIFEADLPLYEKFERFATEYIDECLNNPYLPIFIFTQLNQDGDKFLQTTMGRSLKPKPHHLLRQIEEEVKKGHIRPIAPLQLLLNLISLCIFPFIGKPMLKAKIGIGDEQFILLMEQRRKEVPQFIWQAISVKKTKTKRVSI